MSATSDRAHNAAAEFLPMDAADEASRPCLVVAGVQVYAYVEDGRLRISAHFDTSELGTATPVTIAIGDRDVFWID